MVKIRGYRVDFSEVERALLKHPAIKDAGVRACDHEDRTGKSTWWHISFRDPNPS